MKEKINSKKVELAKNAGFCFGVKEAIALAEKLGLENAQSSSKKKIYTYGSLIHNSHVIESLEQNHIYCIESLAQVNEGDILIIRSHGVPKAFYEAAYEKGVVLKDATCPFVRKVQKIAEEESGKKRNVVIVGDKNHPEVIGISGWCNGKVYIIENETDVFDLKGKEPLSVVAQTTITEALWKNIKESFETLNIKDVVYYNTICQETQIRQKACAELAGNSDAMIVIGDKKSSNSRKLYEISKKNCKNSYFIERKWDLPLKELQKYNKIGVAAGASTPECIIKEVITIMNETNKTEEITENPVVEEATTEVEVIEEASVEVAQAEEKPKAAEPTKKEIKQPSQASQIFNRDEDDPIDENHPMLAFMDEIGESLKLPNRGEIIEGEVIAINDKEVVVNFGCKKDGVLPASEVSFKENETLTSLFSVGDKITAKVLKNDDGDGNLLLSRKKLEASEHWTEVTKAYEEKTYIDVKVKTKVKGGVIANYKEISGFIPMSQLSNQYVENADDYVGKTLEVAVIQVNQSRNKAVFSHKAYLEEQRSKQLEKFWEKVNVGDVVEGKIMRFTDYGAFIDIGGVDALLHISEMSWGRVKHPSEILRLAETVKTKILSADKEKNKISLGLKQLTEEPWSCIDANFSTGDVVEGKVVQLKDYGAFIELMPGLDGLVHISEIAHKHVASPEQELSVGQLVKVKITEINKENKRISLSIRETMEKPAESDISEDEGEKEVSYMTEIEVSEKPEPLECEVVDGVPCEVIETPVEEVATKEETTPIEDSYMENEIKETETVEIKETPVEIVSDEVADPYLTPIETEKKEMPNCEIAEGVPCEVVETPAEEVATKEETTAIEDPYMDNGEKA